MRALWKGAISFGLVNIPVRLYAATERKDPKFNYLHAVCHTPVRYVKWCPTCGREVPVEEIVRGYQYERGQYVIMHEEDFEVIPARTTRSVDIIDFVSLSEIDPVYYDRTYYLEPADGGQKAYGLLRRAMQETGRIGLAKVAIRARETLATVRVLDQRVLAMETMFFPDEVRPAGVLQGLDAVTEPDPRELAMARTLIESLATPFSPAKYQNPYREQLLEIIRAKITGQEVARAPQPHQARVIDLMEALRQSIALAEEERAREAAGR
ncbi:MAG: Ku protein [Bacillota bacterium]